jgi:hypothetical protein
LGTALPSEHPRHRYILEGNVRDLGFAGLVGAAPSTSSANHTSYRQSTVHSSAHQWQGASPASGQRAYKAHPGAAPFLGQVPIWLHHRYIHMLTQPILTKAGNLHTGTASFFRFLEACNIPAYAAFPASDQLLSLWALWLSPEGKAYDTVKNYLCDIATYQIACFGGPSINRSNLPLLNMALKTSRNSLELRQPSSVCR